MSTTKLAGGTVRGGRQPYAATRPPRWRSATNHLTQSDHSPLRATELVPTAIDNKTFCCPFSNTPPGWGERPSPDSIVIASYASVVALSPPLKTVFRFHRRPTVMYWKWRTASGFWGWAVFKRVRGGSGETDAQLVVNMRVRVYPGTQAESRGAIVEDFGEYGGPAR